MVSLAIAQNDWRRWLGGAGNRRLVWLVNGLLILWLAWQLAGLSWALVAGGEGVPAAQAPRSAVPAPPARGRAPDPGHISRWHLFGVAGRQPVARQSPVEAPETRLRLTLRGVFSSDNPKGARAIVADPSGKEEIYAIGDALPGGARLSEIYPDRVILERSGRFETLRLPRRGQPRGAAPRRTAAQASDRNAALQRYRDEIRRDPGAFLKYVQVSPERRDGRFIGFRLREGSQRGVFAQLGLRPGDIVTRVNGVTLDDPAKGLQAMRAVSQGSRIALTLLRDGREISLNFTLPGS